MAKIKIWYHISDGGDGSAYMTVYRTQQEAQDAADQEFKDYGQAFDENVSWEIIDTDDYETIGD